MAFATLRLYCERITDAFWGEPLNALSNLAFWLAAFALWRAAKQIPGGAPHYVKTLILLVWLVGTGSFLFHSFATMGTVLLDLLPVAVLIFYYLYTLGHAVLGLGKKQAWLLFAALLALNLAYKSQVFRSVDGYVSFLPSLVTLLAITLYLLLRRHRSALRMVLASICGTVAFAARAADRPLCEWLPIGTHFVWHIAIAGCAYILVRDIITETKLKSLTSPPAPAR